MSKIIAAPDYTVRADSTTLPPGQLKIRYSSTGATVTVASGALRLNSGSVNNFTGGLRVLAQTLKVADNFDHTFQIKLVSGGAGSTYYPGILFRAPIDQATTIDGGVTWNQTTGISPTRAYSLNYGASGYGLVKQTGGSTSGFTSASTTSTSASFSSAVSTGGVIYLRLRVQGDVMLARGWKSGETEPTTWPVIAVDATVPRKGELVYWLQGGGATNAVIDIQQVTARRLDPTEALPSNLTFRSERTSQTILPQALGHTYLAPVTGTATWTLPAISSLTSFAPLTVVLTTAQTLTLSAAGSDTVNGAASVALSSQYEFVRLIPTLTSGWVIAARASSSAFDTRYASSSTVSPLYAPASITTTTQTGTTYTLVLADAGTVVEMNNAAANTITIPPNSSVAIPIGQSVIIRQYGAGQTTIAAGAGVTIRSLSGLKLSGQYAEASITKRGTDEWVISGAMVP